MKLNDRSTNKLERKRESGGGAENRTTAKRALGGFASAALGFAGLFASGCLERPLCGTEEAPCTPVVSNVIVDQLVSTAVNRIDMLFVIDNSLSMADKQDILVEALPDLVSRFVNPVCVSVADGREVPPPDTAAEDCPIGFSREFSPVDDIHIGVITSSLGDYGAGLRNPDQRGQCETAVNQPWTVMRNDRGRLLGSLPRALDDERAPNGFLQWTSSSQESVFVEAFQNQVANAGEHGCGFEASLEAWVRFLVDPVPYESVELFDCGGHPNACVRPMQDPATGAVVPDETVLAQRRAFLRPDSLLAVVMLTDENDCSFRPAQQAHELTNSFRGAPRASAQCETNPNDPCCQACIFGVTPGCQIGGMTDNGQAVAMGCADEQTFPGSQQGSPEDPPNLRCFQQKRRFGIDLLYPVERYANALKLDRICPFADDFVSCGDDEKVPNPVFSDLTLAARQANDPAAAPIPARSASFVFLAGILGVPWQDIAVDPEADTLVYQTAVGTPNAADPGNPLNRIDWDLIVGPDNATGIPEPLDPLMRESIVERTGVNPRTNEALAPSSSDSPRANSINGHEWNIEGTDDLQYACIFPSQAKECPTRAENAEANENNEQVPNCDCTDGEDRDLRNPLCQAENGDYDLTQRASKAYPSLRQLQALQAYGDNSIVASICPKETQDRDKLDFGYRPAVASIVDRLKEQLADKCLDIPLETTGEGLSRQASCFIVEANASADAECGGSRSDALSEVDPAVATVVRQRLQDLAICTLDGVGAPTCDSFTLCTVNQVDGTADPAAAESCLTDPETSSGDGWCYIDDQIPGTEAILDKCAATQKRQIRFVGDGEPAPGAITFFACNGDAF